MHKISLSNPVKLMGSFKVSVVVIKRIKYSSMSKEFYLAFSFHY